jgi:hypothetical protein
VASSLTRKPRMPPPMPQDIAPTSQAESAESSRGRARHNRAKAMTDAQLVGIGQRRTITNRPTELTRRAMSVRAQIR